MRRILSFSLAAAMLFALCALCAAADPVAFEEEIAALLGKENEGAMFGLAVSSEGYTDNNDAVVKVSLQNVSAESGITVLQFTLKYDPEKLSLVYDKEEDLDDDGAYLLPGVENAKAKKWESLSKIDEENGCIYIKYATTSTSAAAKDDGSIVFPFTFRINEGAEGPFAVFIPHSSISASDAGFNKFKGNGGYVILTEKTEEETGENGGQDGKDIEFTEDSGFEADTEEGLITGLAPDTDAESFLEAIIDSGECVIENPSGSGLVGTGTKLTYNGITYTVVVKGDLDGDGTVQATDYAMVKRAFLGTYDANREQNLAASLTNGETIEAADYVMIKRHFLGTYNIK